MSEQKKIVDMEEILKGMSGLTEENKAWLRNGKEVLVVVAVDYEGKMMVVDSSGEGGSNCLSLAVALGKMARGAQYTAQHLAKSLALDHGSDIAENFLTVFFESMTQDSDQECMKIRNIVNSPEAQPRKPME